LRLILFIFIALLGSLAIVLFILVHSGSERGERLSKELIIGNGCTPASTYRAHEKKSRGATERVAIYILGGTQDSLKLKFRTAVSIYQKGTARNLMIASLEGKTEYAADLDRNLTNDEWTIRQLTGLGVMCEDINFIKLQYGFFGTLREAKTLKTICIDNRINKLLLVCSAYHSKRVLFTFSSIFENTGVDIDIHSADEQVGLRGHFIEYLKLIFYENVLIPLERHCQVRSPSKYKMDSFNIGRCN
jgi:hypothetical protein